MDEQVDGLMRHPTWRDSLEAAALAPVPEPPQQRALIRVQCPVGWETQHRGDAAPLVAIGLEVAVDGVARERALQLLGLLRGWGVDGRLLCGVVVDDLAHGMDWWMDGWMAMFMDRRMHR
eukprot:366332-Chlamydomonas_euryale.AAC.21